MVNNQQFRPTNLSNQSRQTHCPLRLRGQNKTKQNKTHCKMQMYVEKHANTQSEPSLIEHIREGVLQQS